MKVLKFNVILGDRLAPAFTPIDSLGPRYKAMVTPDMVIEIEAHPVTEPVEVVMMTATDRYDLEAPSAPLAVETMVATPEEVNAVPRGGKGKV
jgi:hypothetical protein